MRVVRGCVLVIGASACSLTTPLDGFSSGVDDVPRDASVPDDVAAVSDGAASPQPMSGFCKSLAPAPRLCLDFDDSSAGALAWKSVVTAGGSLELTSTLVRSPPRAGRAGIVPGGDVRKAYVSRTVGNAHVEHVRLAYSLFVEEKPTDGEVEVNTLRLDSSGYQSYFYLSLGATRTLYWQQRSTAAGDDATPLGDELPISVGKWARVSIEIRLGDAKTGAIIVDGVPLGVRPINPNMGPGTPDVAAGIVWAQSGDRAKVVVDDLTFEVLR